MSGPRSPPREVYFSRYSFLSPKCLLRRTLFSKTTVTQVSAEGVWLVQYAYNDTNSINFKPEYLNMARGATKNKSFPPDRLNMRL